DPAVVPWLVRTLKNGRDSGGRSLDADDEVRRAACWAVWRIHTAMARVVQKTAKAAAVAAAAADGVREGIMPALIERLHFDNSVIVRLQAQEALEGLVPESIPEPDVVTGQSSDIPPVSDEMREELAKIRKQLDTFCLVGEILLKDEKGRIRKDPVSTF